MTEMIKMWVVPANEWNYANCKGIIGKFYDYDSPPSYAIVKLVYIDGKANGLINQPITDAQGIHQSG